MTLSALTSSANLRDAVRIIEETRKTIAVVTDDAGRVIGALTDGDIRRALLAGRELSDSVTEAMNPSPWAAPIPVRIPTSYCSAHWPPASASRWQFIAVTKRSHSNR